jgi:hypothetical protein
LPAAAAGAVPLRTPAPIQKRAACPFHAAPRSPDSRLPCPRRNARRLVISALAAGGTVTRAFVERAHIHGEPAQGRVRTKGTTAKLAGMCLLGFGARLGDRGRRGRGRNWQLRNWQLEGGGGAPGGVIAGAVPLSHAGGGVEE